MLRSTSNLKKAKFPVKQILQTPDLYQNSINLRNVKLHGDFSVAKLQNLSSQIADLTIKRQTAATARNALVNQIKKLVGTQIEQDKLKGELLARSKALKTELSHCESELGELAQVQDRVLESIPNLVDPDSASIDEYEAIDTINPRECRKNALDHTEIGKRLGILDLAAGSRVSGTGHYYLVGAGAMLEQALVSYALEKCAKWEFMQVNVPQVVRSDFTNACGFKPRDTNNEVQVYSVSGGSNQQDLCLIGTAEIPLASWKAHSTVETPLRACAVSRSFRAEAGARGADTRGLYRVHEFTKVEMFMWTDPDLGKSQEALQTLLGYQKELVEELGIHAKVLKMGPTELGSPAYAKYDIEAWMPGREKWGEISSVSNCTDFQSRRLWTVNKEGQFVHTLNGTALAVPRIIIAILENNYDAEKNRVKVPQVLRKWMPEYISGERSEPASS